MSVYRRPSHAHMQIPDIPNLEMKLPRSFRWNEVVQSVTSRKVAVCKNEGQGQLAGTKIWHPCFHGFQSYCVQQDWLRVEFVYNPGAFFRLGTTKSVKRSTNPVSSYVLLRNFYLSKLTPAYTHLSIAYKMHIRTVFGWLFWISGRRSFYTYTTEPFHPLPGKTPAWKSPDEAVQAIQSGNVNTGVILLHLSSDSLLVIR